MSHTMLFRKLILAMQSARRENLNAQGLPLPISSTTNDWSRRKFIKATTAFGVASLVGNGALLSSNAKAEGKKPPRIAIIGAGLAGLNAAYQLKKAGYLATVYEARSRIGGRIRSVDIGNGLIVDLGAELINTDHADMLSLVNEFGIELFNRIDIAESLPYPKEIFIFNGRRHSESQLADDLRAIAAQIGEDANLLDQDWDTYAPNFDALSVADYLFMHQDKIKKPYIFELFTHAIRTEYGVEPHESSALQLLFILPVVDGQAVELLSYSDEVYSVVGGSAQITNALGAQLNGQIQLGMALKEIKQQSSSYRLSFANHSIIEADIVIIAIPFPVLKTVNMNVRMPARLRRFINEAQLGSNEKLLASFSNRFWHHVKGFTQAAWADLGFSELWDATQRQSARHDGVLNFFLGGSDVRALEKMTNMKSLGYKFISRLNHFIPGALNAATGKFLKTSWTKSFFTKGGYANYGLGQLTKFGSLLWVESDIADEQQQVYAGNIIFIGEHLSDAYYGFMNGAAQTGRLAAKLTVKKLLKLNIDY